MARFFMICVVVAKEHALPMSVAITWAGAALAPFFEPG